MLYPRIYTFWTILRNVIMVWINLIWKVIHAWTVFQTSEGWCHFANGAARDAVDLHCALLSIWMDKFLWQYFADTVLHYSWNFHMWPLSVKYQYSYRCQKRIMYKCITLLLKTHCNDVNKLKQCTHMPDASFLNGQGHQGIFSW